jgi:hypothetical protein
MLFSRLHTCHISLIFNRTEGGIATVAHSEWGVKMRVLAAGCNLLQPPVSHCQD